MKGLAAIFATLSAGVAVQAASACDVALMLAVDVSGSVDAGEYLLQIEGTATALSDPEVADAMVFAKAAVAIM